jgi:hypothetical protein
MPAGADMTTQGASPASGRSERYRRLQDSADMARHLDLLPGDFLGNPRVSWQWAFSSAPHWEEIGYPDAINPIAVPS